jgi:type II secretory pathway component PulM
MSALGDMSTKLRDLGRRVSARPLAYLAGWWERRAPRERRNLSVFVGAILGVIVIFGTYWVFSSVTELEEDNAAIRDALKAIANNRDIYLEAKARSDAQAARIGTEAPQLTGDIEAAAKAEQLEIAESSERPPTPAGRRYLEHDLDIKIREVDLQSLSKFMQRLETGPRLIVFTRLSIKRRFSDQQKLEVEATATAFERVKEEKTKKKPGEGGNAGKGGEK